MQEALAGELERLLQRRGLGAELALLRTLGPAAAAASDTQAGFLGGEGIVVVVCVYGWWGSMRSVHVCVP